MPPVSVEGMWSVRRTVADTRAVAAVDCTGPIRPIMPGAVSGSLALSPSSVWPASTVRRLVPRASSSARRLVRLEAEIPRTATMAAIPRAIPAADRIDRSRRARRPPTATLRRLP